MANSDYAAWAHPTWVSPPFSHAFPPTQFRFQSAPEPPGSTDFVDGTITVAANPVAQVSQDGCTAQVYTANTSMSKKGRYLRNADADTLILPQEGILEIRTEFGTLKVEPLELALIPRGMVFQVNLAGGSAKGYFLENAGAHFVIPDMGPIGISSGLAHPRHFLAPHAEYEEVSGDFELVSKFAGQLFRSKIQHSPLDVVAWYGNFVPLKYDMRLFMAINSVTYDHPDPSITVVMSSYTNSPGLANCDFVIFAPRWNAAENTFRPPWYHRNMMSEFMGLIHGTYDAKPDSFKMGASSIHNRFTPHGPDGKAVSGGTALDTSKPERYSNTLAFMWETRLPWHPSAYALSNLNDAEYPQCWGNIPKRFDPNNKPPAVEPYGFPFSGSE
jgi:homogentisate 1,2-dioxygenase